MDYKPIELTLGKTQTKISPLICGQFIEFIENCISGGIYDPGSPAADKKGIRQDVLEKSKGLRPTILRWPGGTYANIYHLEDSVGPAENRKRRRNLIWGGINDGVFGTAEFIEYCRALGAEPMICVNLASGTAEEAANWVEYCNSEPGTHYADLRVSHGYPEPFDVKYWCIGNESYAIPDIGAQHDPDIYIRDAWEFVKFMKLTDPSIKLIFVGNLDNDDWNRKILEAFGQVCDYLSIHHYSRERDRGLYEPFLVTRDYEAKIEQLATMLDSFSNCRQPLDRWYRFSEKEADIKLCLDEWNIWNSAVHSDNNKYGVKIIYNWRDALWTAATMNMIIRHAAHIEIANMAQMVNVLAPIMTQGNHTWVQTTYHVLKLYRDHLQGNFVQCFADIPLLDADGASIPVLDMSACQHETGVIKIFAVNLSEKDTYQLCLPSEYQVVKSEVMSAASFLDCNSLASDCVTNEWVHSSPTVLRSGSVTLIEVIQEGK